MPIASGTLQQLDRLFADVTPGQIADPDALAAQSASGGPGFGWETLLESPRVLMVAEAGSGKTHECRQQRRLMWEAGQAAFFFELASLATAHVNDLLSPDELARLDVWKVTPMDVATFFLDSFDELKLSFGSFRTALTRLRNVADGNLHRIRLVVTTRPTPVDEAVLREVLPVLQLANTPPTEAGFVEFALVEPTPAPYPDNTRVAPDWCRVILLPLTAAQVRVFAARQGVTDPKAFWLDLLRRHATVFARRPQDLIEMCQDWRAGTPVRTHLAQVAANVDIKLQQRADRPEASALSLDRAKAGAGLLALAMVLVRKFTLRHSAEADVGGPGAGALDPAVILTAWSREEIRTLLERPLFSFASWGRVRFHHRSVFEYLAARHLQTLLNAGMRSRACLRLLMTDTAQGRHIVRPSLAPVAAWLSLTHAPTFEALRLHSPATLLSHGDPASLSDAQRAMVLKAYVGLYGVGDWRGLSVPGVQVERFASEGLAPILNELWRTGIEAPEVRLLAIDLVRAGRCRACLDWVDAVAQDPMFPGTERVAAVSALAAAGDPRFKRIINDVVGDRKRWAADLARDLVIGLFPEFIMVPDVLRILASVPDSEESFGELSWHLPEILEHADFSQADLGALCDGLFSLVSEGLARVDDWPPVFAPRMHLVPALAVVCTLLWEAGHREPSLIDALALVLVVMRPDYGSYSRASERVTILRSSLQDITADAREALFWSAERLISRLDATSPFYQYFADCALDGPVVPEASKDKKWILAALGDPARSIPCREMLLEIALRWIPAGAGWLDEARGLAGALGGEPRLLVMLGRRTATTPGPKAPDPVAVRLEGRRLAEQKAKEAEATRWRSVWARVRADPEGCLGPGSDGTLARELFELTAFDRVSSRHIGWNRRLVEANFGVDVANHLCLALASVWRSVRPLFHEERDRGQEYVADPDVRVALAGISAEAETPGWARRLSVEEAALAARYLTGPSELPGWLDDLLQAHPAAVKHAMDIELRWELNALAQPHFYAPLLERLRYGPAHLAPHFLPTVVGWVDRKSREQTPGTAEERDHLGRALAKVLEVLMAVNDDASIDALRTIALRACEANPDEVEVWLPILMQLSPVHGVAALERVLAQGDAGSEGVRWIARLFGGRRGYQFDFSRAAFPPAQLQQLLLLAYEHVSPLQDNQSSEQPARIDRHDAERGRSRILDAVLELSGQGGWQAKNFLADHALFSHFRHRIVALAEDHAAQEADIALFTEAQMMELQRLREGPPTTPQDTFSLLMDRLDEIDDVLKRDYSPREAWSGFKSERVFRRAIAEQLDHLSNGVYRVSQESVTGDEKETDLCLSAIGSDQEAVIELKMAESNYSATDLRDAIKSQLLEKYLRPAHRRAGVLLITLAHDRAWRHPDTGAKLEFDALISFLDATAKEASIARGGCVWLACRGLDLRSSVPVGR